MRSVPAALLLLAALSLAGCSKASQPSADNPVITSPSSSPADSATTPPPSTPTGSSSVPLASPASSSRPVPSATVHTPGGTTVVTPSRTPVPIDGPGGCPTSSLTVRALRASGAAGHQYAFLQFTNSSAKSCSLTGFPGVQLLRAGAPLGQPALRSAAGVSRVQLAPGTAVTARLVDDSTCNADNSDSVQVIPPNRTDKIVLALSLRGCTLHIDPVTTG